MIYRKYFIVDDIKDLVYKYTGNSLFLENDSIIYKFGDVEIDVTKVFELFFLGMRINDTYYCVIGECRLDIFKEYNKFVMLFVERLIELESK